MMTNLYQGELLRIERFVLEPTDPAFHRHGHIDDPVIVFPKHSIWIRHDGSESFVADPSIVNFYNRGQIYTRQAIHPGGDDCHVVSLSHEVMCEIMGEERPQTSVFDFEHLPCERACFLAHLDLLNRLERSERIEVEEGFLDIFGRLVGQARPHRPLLPRGRHRRLAERVKESLQLHLDRNLSLDQLASMHDTSPFHLCRIFKRTCGYGISRYRMQQRLRAALIDLQAGADDLGTLALSYGFSSHSHLTSSFRRHYGQCPSRLRDRLSRPAQ